MSALFTILFFVSLLILIVGLVKPETLNSKIKDETKHYDRKKVLKVFGIATILFLILIGITAPKTEKQPEQQVAKEEVKKEEPAPAKTEEVKEEPKTEPAIPALTYSEATSYQKTGKTWKMVVFSRKPTNDELKKAAIELHSKDKSSYFTLFDDNGKIEEYKNWDINYGKVRDKDGKAKLATDCIDIAYCVDLVSKNQEAYPLPKEWADQHEVGLINEMYSNGSMKWQLSTSLGEKLSDL